MGFAERRAYKRQTGRRPEDEPEGHFEDDDVLDFLDEDLPSAMQID